MIASTMTRIAISILISVLLAPVLSLGLSIALPSPVSAQSRCGETGSELFIRWTQADLPMEYFMLIPDASQGWSSDVVGFFGIPIYYPAGWSYQLPAEGAGVFMGANDGSATYGFQALTNVTAGITSDQAALEITSALLGGASGSVLCATGGVIHGDLPTQYTILSAQQGDSIALAYAMVLPNPSTGQAMVTYYAMSGPANRFADLMVSVFLPMMNMYIRTHGAF